MNDTIDTIRSAIEHYTPNDSHFCKLFISPITESDGNIEDNAIIKTIKECFCKHGVHTEIAVNPYIDRHEMNRFAINSLRRWLVTDYFAGYTDFGGIIPLGWSEEETAVLWDSEAYGKIIIVTDNQRF